MGHLSLRLRQNSHKAVLALGGYESRCLSNPKKRSPSTLSARGSFDESRFPPRTDKVFLNSIMILPNGEINLQAVFTHVVTLVMQNQSKDSIVISRYLLKAFGTLEAG